MPKYCTIGRIDTPGIAGFAREQYRVARRNSDLFFADYTAKTINLDGKSSAWFFAMAKYNSLLRQAFFGMSRQLKNKRIRAL
jgi:hypothetical protein